MAKDSGKAPGETSCKSIGKRNPPRRRPRTRARRPSAGTRCRTPRAGPSLKDRLAKARQAKARKRMHSAYAQLRKGVLGPVTRQEAEVLARETGFYQRTPQEIPAFEFALCCALAAMVELKRGFAS